MNIAIKRCQYFLLSLFIISLAACGGSGGDSAGGDSSSHDAASSDSSSNSSDSSSDGGASNSSTSSSSSLGSPGDTTPNDFRFNGRTGVELNVQVESDAIVVTGTDAPTGISISGGEYSVDGGPYSAEEGTVENNQTVVVRVTSSGSFDTTVDATLTIGGVSGVFSVTTAAPPRAYFQPGQYASVEDCFPFEGDASTPLKVFFINIDDAPFFQELRDDGVEQFRTIEPFSHHFNQTAFYSVSIQLPDDKKCTQESGFGCSNHAVNDALLSKCTIDDHRGVIKIAILESDYTATGGEIIYMGSHAGDLETVLDFNERAVIHEVGHNFGLADLRSGGYRFDGGQYEIWPKEFSRRFPNVDAPGCPKWCNGYRPASEYNGTPAAECLTFETKEICLAHNRDETGDCTSTPEALEGVGCCSWVDEPAEYFETQCVPVLDDVNIGLDCYADSGCYLGATYANHTWRPVRTREDSIMYNQSASDQFDAVSLRELNETFRCCLTAEDANPGCEAYRTEYANFLFDTNFKKRIGSCGVKPQVLE